MATTNFIDGVTNVASSSALGSYLAPDPSWAHVYFNDFDFYTVADWTETGTGTQAILAGGDGGQLVMTNTAADNDINAIVLANLTFLLDPTKSFWMKGRLKADDVIQSDILFGLMNTMTGFDPTNGVYLFKDDGASPLRLSIEKAGAKTDSFSTSVASEVANNTFVDLAITYDASERVVKGWVNGQAFGQISDLTNFPNTVAVAPAVGIRNGEAVAKVLTVDYMLFAKQR
jgi:hypothetical protein